MANLDEFYGDRFEKLIPQIIANIQREIDRITLTITDGNIADDLRITFLLENEAELKQAIQNILDNGYASAISGAYTDAIDQGNDLLDESGVPFRLRRDQTELISTLKRSNTLLYSLNSSESASLVFDALVSWAYSGDINSLQPFNVALEELGAIRHGRTIINTQVSKFFRVVNLNASLNAGVRRFRYAGPTPEREFCQGIFNQVFTIEEINKMDNGQTNDVFTTGGGFNCRHFWVPVAASIGE